MLSGKRYIILSFFLTTTILFYSQLLHPAGTYNSFRQNIQDTSIKIKPIINKTDTLIKANQDTSKKILTVQDTSLLIKTDSILPLLIQDTVKAKKPKAKKDKAAVTSVKDTTLPQKKVKKDTTQISIEESAKPIKNIGDTLELNIDSSRVYYFTSTIENFNLGKIKPIDTILSGIQNYDPNFGKGRYYASLGNTGLPAKNLQFSPQIKEGFNYSLNPLEIYTYQNDDVKYYRLVKPFTEVFYVMGPKKENTLRVIHSQNITKGLNIGINFKFINAPGIYQRQSSDNKNLYLTARYSTEKNRYGFVANYMHDKLIVEENGGLESDSAFIYSLEVNRALIDVNLLSAQNTYKKGSFFLNQYFNLGRDHYIKSDTSKNAEEKKGLKLGQLSHSVYAERKSFLFEDQSGDNQFFAGFDEMLNATSTFDSTRILLVENQLKWSNLGYEAQPENKKLYLYFGLKHQYVEVYDTLSKQIFNHLIPKAGFTATFLKTTKLSVDGFYVVGDKNDGDYSLNASVNQTLNLTSKLSGNLFLSAQLAKQSPAYFYNLYHGNYLRWENDFEAQNYLILKAKYTLWGISAGANYHKIDHFIFMDKKAHPQQTDITQSVLSASLGISKSIRDFNLDINVLYQKAKSDSLIRLPEFTGHLSFNWTKGLFKNATTIQPGIEVFYNTSYFAEAYMPATRSFYLQNLKNIGNAIYADFYFNFTIKNTMFFFKYQHFNAAITGFNYFLVPHYPMPDYAIKFGVIWKFMD